MLDALDTERVPASFFVQGRWAEAYPELARSIGERGHLIGNHSFYHARMPLLSATGLSSDVRAAERAIIATTGIDPRPWFRCPFGAGSDDPGVAGGDHPAWLSRGVLGRGGLRLAAEYPGTRDGEADDTGDDRAR